MIFTIDFHSRSPTLPSIKIPCYREMIDPKICHDLRELVLKEEPNILANTPMPDHQDDPTWLTGRLWNYNFLKFDDPQVKYLHTWIAKQYKDFAEGMKYPLETVYIQCWANVVRPGGRLITKHNHAGSHINAPPENAYISGNLFLGESTDTKTYYQNPFLDKRAVGVPNIPGMVILFPSYVDHWIDGTKTDKVRVSLAFDIITKEVFDLINSDNFIPLNW